jgi:hypothetical protein
MKGDVGERGGDMRSSDLRCFLWAEVDPRRTITKSELSDEQLFIYVHVNICGICIKLRTTVDRSATFLQPAGSKTHPKYSEL